MGKEMYQVKIGGQTRLYEAGTTYREIAKEIGRASCRERV